MAACIEQLRGSPDLPAWLLRWAGPVGRKNSRAYPRPIAVIDIPRSAMGADRAW